MTKVFVGGLSFDTTEDGLSAFFQQVGAVESVFVAMDDSSGCSKGFGFVEMATVAGARGAVQDLNGRDLDGCPLIVELAQPPDPRAFRAA